MTRNVRPSGAIAIVGMACRFPGAASVDAFWRNLHDGVESITFFSAEALAAAGVSAELLAQPHYVRAAALLDDIDKFDAGFFGYAPREAAVTDPQHRMFLEVAWEAFEAAGYHAESYPGVVGVFAGAGGIVSSYLVAHAGHPALAGETATLPYIGNDKDFLATRVSFKLNLSGPSVTVQTACSTSLVAVHLACQSLLAGESDMALAGAATVRIPHLRGYLAERGAVHAPDGRCRPFDAHGQGAIFGSGVAAVLLKRLDHALADGDHVHAVIRGTSIVNDGAAKKSFAAPSATGQARAMTDAMARAGVTADTLDYVECHAAGTPVGDPLEVEALGRAFAATGGRTTPCAIGSVKGNIGHPEQAAGLAALIKTVLALEHRELPATLNFSAPNPHIDFASGPFVVNAARTPWPAGARPRRAAVNSLGIGGTNAFVVLQEAPPRAVATAEEERPVHVFTLSARTETALAAYVDRFRAFLRTRADADLADLCFTSNVSRSAFAHRLATTATSVSELAHQLERASARRAFRHRGTAPRVAFLFTGQGAQQAGMAAGLYRAQPTFREALDRCGAAFRAHLERPLLDVMFGRDADAASLLDRTEYTQPALFALEYGLAEMWRTWGVTPAAVMGHSLGEVVAACVAGAIGFDDAVRFVAARSRLMQDLPERGAMAAVFASEETVRAALPPGDAVVVAAQNGPQNTVISGEREAVHALVERLTAGGIESRLLPLANGFHSPLVEPMLDALEAAAGEVAWAPPRVPFVSNLTGAVRASLDARYWREHARHGVRFADGVRACAALGCDVFLELGPGSTLLGLASQVLPAAGPPAALVPSLSRQKPDWRAVQEALQGLYLEAVPIDWDAVHRGAGRRRCPLPTYPFQRRRYWVDDVHVEPLGARETRREAARNPGAPEGIERRPQAVASGSLAMLRREPFEAPALAQRLEALPTRAPRTEWLYRLQWEEVALPAQAPPPAVCTWLVFADAGDVGARLAEALTARGDTCHRIRPAQGFGRERSGEWTIDPERPDHFARLLRLTGNGPPIAGAVYLWALDGPPLDALDADALWAEQARSIGAAVRLARALGDARDAGAFAGRLHFVTRTAQRVAPDDPPSEALQAMLWGFGRTLALERAELWGGAVDLGAHRDAAHGSEIDALAGELRATDREDQVALRGARRFGARLVACAPSAPHDALLPVRDDATYLVTGGLGMLGLRTARWLVERGARSIVLAGRSGAHGAAADAVEHLRHRGARVQVVAADVADPADVERLVDGLRGLPPLRGVVHGAGVLDNATVPQLDWTRFERVAAPKVLGAWLLHRRTRDLELDFFVLQSTLLSLIGSPGQSNYTAANAFLDALGSHRRARGLPATVLNWTAWAEAGLASGAGRRNEDAWRAMGLAYLAPEDGVDLFAALLRPAVEHAAVAIADWPRYVRHLGRRPALLAHLAPDVLPTPHPAVTVVADGADPARRRADVGAPDRRAALLERVRHEVAEQMGFDAPIDSRRPLSELGLDSLMSATVATRLESALGIAVPVAKLIQGPSIERLVDDLAPDLVARDEPSPDAPAGGEPATSAAASDGGISRIAGNGWLVFPRPNPAAKLRLVCFPYAGGNAAVYRPWSEALRPDIELVAIDPPGRAARVHERAFDDFEKFFDALLPELAALTDLPLAFYGHCLGGITLYEAIRRLRAKPGFDLRHVFVSSSRAPRRLLRVGKFEEDLLGRLLTLPDYDPFVPPHAQKDGVFAELIRRFNIGASEEFLGHDELKRLLMPAIRAEFRMAARYRFRGDAPWDAPLTCFVGAEDPYVSREDALAWSEHTRRDFRLHMRDGDHFLVVDDRAFIVDCVNRELAA